MNLYRCFKHKLIRHLQKDYSNYIYQQTFEICLQLARDYKNDNEGQNQGYTTEDVLCFESEVEAGYATARVQILTNFTMDFKINLTLTIHYVLMRANRPKDIGQVYANC